MSYKYFHFLSSHASLKQEQELMRVDKREFVREFSLTIDQMKTRVAWELIDKCDITQEFFSLLCARGYGQ